MKVIYSFFLAIAFGLTFSSCLSDPIEYSVDEEPIFGGVEHFQMTDSIFYVSSDGAELETTILNYTSFDITDSKMHI